MRGLELLAEFRHRRVLLVGGATSTVLARSAIIFWRGRARALDPAADLVPVLVEEDDDGDGAVAVVEKEVGDVEVLVAEEHAQLAVRHGLADVGEDRRVAVHVAAPVLREHERVLDLAERAPLKKARSSSVSADLE